VLDIGHNDTMHTVSLGSQGLTVSAQGLGAMGMSAWYGARDEAESAATLNRALDIGVTFIDTAEAYGPFNNEKLISRAIGGRRDEAIIATKFGAEIADDGTRGDVNGTPNYARIAVDRSLRHLGIDTIDLYYLHRVDPKVAIEETIGAMAEMVQAGKVRYLGISEAAPDTIRRAHAVHPLTAVQSEYSMYERGMESNGVLDVVRELGIGFVAYSPLGRGLLGGKINSVDELDADDFRRFQPRFQPEHIATNAELLARLTKLAESKGATAAQLALAWVMAQPGVVPIPGTKRRNYLEQNAAATELSLSSQDLAWLDTVLAPGAVSGERGNEQYLSAVYK